MTLVDGTNGGNIINPYITIYSLDKQNWMSINTDTFGEAQEFLISIFAKEEQLKLERLKEKSKLYKVVATVAKQNFWDNSEKQWGRSVRIEGIDDAVATVPLGYLKEEHLKKYLPKVYAWAKAKEES